jgi:hypothetical protein
MARQTRRTTLFVFVKKGGKAALPGKSLPSGNGYDEKGIGMPAQGPPDAPGIAVAGAAR